MNSFDIKNQYSLYIICIVQCTLCTDKIQVFEEKTVSLFFILKYLQCNVQCPVYTLQCTVLFCVVLYCVLHCTYRVLSIYCFDQKYLLYFQNLGVFVICYLLYFKVLLRRRRFGGMRYIRDAGLGGRGVHRRSSYNPRLKLTSQIITVLLII